MGKRLAKIAKFIWLGNAILLGVALTMLIIVGIGYGMYHDGRCSGIRMMREKAVQAGAAEWFAKDDGTLWFRWLAEKEKVDGK